MVQMDDTDQKQFLPLQQKTIEAGDGSDFLEEESRNIVNEKGEALAPELLKALATERRKFEQSLGLNSLNAADVDYTAYETKNNWRQKWLEFLAANIPERSRSSLKVLGLFGVYCSPDVEPLINMGFRPQNITAVENSKDHETAFLTSCENLSINGCYGDILEILIANREEYAVYILDFPGQVCSKYMEILSNLALGNRAVLIINLMGAREKKGIQQIMTMHSHWHEITTQAGGGAAAILQQYETLKITDFSTDLKTDRSGSLTGLVESLAGYKKSFERFAAKNFPATFLADEAFEKAEKARIFTRIALDNFSYLLTWAFSNNIKSLNAEEFMKVRRLIAIILEILFLNTHLVKNSEHYFYKSGASKSGTPYLSEFLILERPRELLNPAREVLTLFKEYFRCWIGQGDKKSQVFCQRKGNKLEIYDNRQFIGGISLRDFQKFLITAVESCDGWHSVNNSRGERIEIR